MKDPLMVFAPQMEVFLATLALLSGCLPLSNLAQLSNCMTRDFTCLDSRATFKKVMTVTSFPPAGKCRHARRGCHVSSFELSL